MPTSLLTLISLSFRRARSYFYMQCTQSSPQVRHVRGAAASRETTAPTGAFSRALLVGRP